MPSPHTPLLSRDAQSSSSHSYSFTTWTETPNSNSDLSSPFDEFATESHLSTPNSSTTCGPNNSEPLPLETISPVFIGMVGHEYNLTDVQMSNICALYHLITSVGGGLTVCDGSVRILTQALQYQSENRLLLAILALNGNSTSPDVSQGEIRGVFEDLQIRLEENFTLTKEQQELIYQASCTGFKRLHLDVESKIRNKPETYRMVNVFGQPARESAFLSAVKRIVSGVRNSFRQDIWDSVLPGNSQSSLEAFTVNTMHKYQPASLSETINNGYLVHNALLRRFAHKNLDLLGVAEDEDQEGSDVGIPLATGQKCKRTNRGKGGRIPNGEDFWSRVDAWFSEEMAKRDNDLTGSLWKPYVEETLRLDNQKFNPTFAPNSSPRVAMSSMVSGQSGSIGATPSTIASFTENSSGSHIQPSAADTLLNALRGARS